MGVVILSASLGGHPFAWGIPHPAVSHEVVFDVISKVCVIVKNDA